MHPPSNKLVTSKLSVDMKTLLGKGSTGNVYQGVFLEPHPHPVAVKVIPLEEINNQVTSYLLQCELEALKLTSKSMNQSIVKLEQIHVYENCCYIATQLLQGGTLKDYISQCKKLQPNAAIHILKCLLQGYRILQTNGIIHRDLKPDNIIFTKNPNNNPLIPKIVDFGYCIVDRVQKKPKAYYNVGSPRYMSPQAYANNKYSQKSDIWALGIVFYEMLTGTNFDKGKQIMQTFKLIKQKGIPIPSNLNSQCRKILQQMLMLDFSKRSNCEQILRLIQHQDANIQNPMVATAHTSSIKQYKLQQNKSFREYRNITLPDPRVINSGRIPNDRIRVMTTSLMKGNQKMNGSRTIQINSQNHINRLSGFNINQTSLRLQRGKPLYQSINQQGRQSLGIMKKQIPFYQIINEKNMIEDNKMLLTSSSDNRFNPGEIQNKINQDIGRQEVKNRVFIKDPFLIPIIKQCDQKVMTGQQKNQNIAMQAHLSSLVEEAIKHNRQLSINIPVHQSLHSHHPIHFLPPNQHNQIPQRALVQSLSFIQPNMIQNTINHQQNNSTPSSYVQQPQVYCKPLTQSNKQHPQQQQSLIYDKSIHHEFYSHIDNSQQQQQPKHQLIQPQVVQISNQIVPHQSIQSQQNQPMLTIAQSQQNHQLAIPSNQQPLNQILHHNKPQFTTPQHQTNGVIKPSQRNQKMEHGINQQKLKLIDRNRYNPCYEQITPDIIIKPRIIEQVHV